MPKQRLAWLFPGQGAQQVGMGRDLFDTSAAARDLFQRADRILDFPLSTICFEGPEEKLQETQFAQPALFAVSFACLEAARERNAITGETPAFVAGHSLGEYTALAAAGAMTFEDGLRLVRERGRLMHEAGQGTPGTMAALLGLDEDAVAAICNEAGAELCNVNAPGQIVIGGEVDAVVRAMALATERGARRAVRLKVSGAFHTSLMQPAIKGMEQAVANTAFQAAGIPVIANTTAEPLTKTSALRKELINQIARPVQWQRSVEYLIASGVTGLIEFGPGRVLTGLARRMDRSISIRNVTGADDLDSA